MGLTTEKRLKALEDEIKALKAAYKIYGGAMRLYESISPYYSVDGAMFTKIKFTPDYNNGSDVFIASAQYFYRRGGITPENLTTWLYFLPQDGDDSITMIAPSLFNGEVQVSVMSTVPGTFTRVL